MFKIAIDGPAGAGKSTIAKLIAQKLNIEYIDTGAMYRAITLKALRLGINMEKDEEYDFLENTVLDICNGKFIMDGEDVSQAIRTVEVTENVSTPSKIGVVREFLVKYQRKISESKSVIMDGRDIGTVVLPNAELKIYLDASVECRARRRMLERASAGVVISLEDQMEEIKVRDHKDSTRKISPLKCAEDAVVVDSSNMTIEEVVNCIINLVMERGLFNMSENEQKYFVGQTVTGTVTGVTSNAIYLEIEEGVKAVIYANDLLDMPSDGKLYNEYSEGAEFSAQVKAIGQDKKNPNEVLLTLSTRLSHDEQVRQEKEAALEEKIAAFKAIQEADEIIKAKVSRVNNGGADLIYNNTRLFLSFKQSSLSKEALQQMKGEEIEVLVVYVNVEKHQVAVSQIAAEKKQRRLAKEAAYAAIEVGQVCEAEVVSLMEYGAIVKVGEVTGLLHISEVDHSRVKDIKKFLTVGQQIKVKVIKVENGKVSFSIRQLTKHPWEVLKEQYHVGDVFEGEVSKIIPAGLIIKLTDEYTGLMPFAEYSWAKVDKIESKFAEGDKVELKVVSIDDKKHRVSLSHRQTVENVWGKVKLHKGQIIEVEIASIVDGGAQVLFQEVNGFLPVSQVSNEKRVTSVGDVYPAGSKVNVMVQEFDMSREKLVVSIKAIDIAKERETFDKYMEEQKSEATTTTLAEIFAQRDQEEE